MFMCQGVNECVMGGDGKGCLVTWLVTALYVHVLHHIRAFPGTCNYNSLSHTLQIILKVHPDCCWGSLKIDRAIRPREMSNSPQKWMNGGYFLPKTWKIAPVNYPSYIKHSLNVYKIAPVLVKPKLTPVKYWWGLFFSFLKSRPVRKIFWPLLLGCCFCCCFCLFVFSENVQYNSLSEFLQTCFLTQLKVSDQITFLTPQLTSKFLRFWYQ